MKRDKIERWILLRSAGELGRWRTRRLERLLARDPEARAFEADVARLAREARAWSVAQPGSHTAEAIHARLHAAPDRRETLALAPDRIHRWWPALAGVTAALVLALGLWVALSGSMRTDVAEQPQVEALAWEDGVDAELDALQEWLLSSTAEDQASAAPLADEEQLIRELLAMEGITI